MRARVTSPEGWTDTAEVEGKMTYLPKGWAAQTQMTDAA